MTDSYDNDNNSWQYQTDNLDDDETISTVAESNNDDDDSQISDNFPNKLGQYTQIKKLKTKRHPDCYKVTILQRVKQNIRYKRKTDGKWINKKIVKIKNMPVYFYETSSNPGSTIRDAITGQYYHGYTVGKYKFEDQFYKTAYCVGDACKPGQKIGDNREPQFLYFMNPESYERHFKTNLSNERKEKWYNNQIELRNQRAETQHTPLTVTIK